MPLGWNKDVPAHFKDDSSVSACEKCATPFAVVFEPRRHHCRVCGGIFCHDCSAQTCEVPGFSGKQRVCNKCHDEMPDTGPETDRRSHGGAQSSIDAAESLRKAKAAKEKGNAALQRNDFHGAIAAYTEAIELDDTNHVYYSNRSAAYALNKAFEHALSDANRSIQLEPTFARGYGRKGAALHGLGRLAEAEQAYARGLQVDPGNNQLSQGLASVIAKRDRPSKSTCPSGHALVKFVLGTSHDKKKMRCDVCGSFPPRGAQMYGCRACDYDECTSCFTSGNGVASASSGRWPATELWQLDVSGWGANPSNGLMAVWRMRNAPSLSARVIREVQQGEIIAVVERRDGWLRTDTNEWTKETQSKESGPAYATGSAGWKRTHLMKGSGVASPDVARKYGAGAPKNDAGATVRRSGRLFYCGRRLGINAIPGSDGQCGPLDGPQCISCKRYQAKTDPLPHNTAQHDDHLNSFQMFGGEDPFAAFFGGGHADGADLSGGEFDYPLPDIQEQDSTHRQCDPFALLDQRPLLSSQGAKTAQDLSLRGKVAVGLFFSGHWCPPSREFTPRLIAAYNQWARAKNFEIIFISSDRTQVCICPCTASGGTFAHLRF